MRLSLLLGGLAAALDKIGIIVLRPTNECARNVASVHPLAVRYFIA